MGVKVEGALKIAGDFGLWHWSVIILASLPGLFFVWHGIGFFFVGAIPDHWCEIPELKAANWSVQDIKNVGIPKKIQLGKEIFSQCQMFQRNYTDLAGLDPKEVNMSDLEDIQTVDCQHWEFDTSTFTSTVATEWELVCDRLHILSTIHSTYPVGVLLSSVIMGGLSDRYGRRTCCVMATALMTPAAIASYFSVDYIMLGILRMILGFCTFAMYACCYSLVAELCPDEKRSGVTFFFDIFAASGRWAVSLVAFFFRDWQSLLLAFALPTCICILFYIMLPESPRWLLVKGRRAEAERILLRAAKFNKHPPPEPELLRNILEATKDEVEQKGNQKGLFTRVIQVLTIFVRTREMRRRSLPMFFCWFVISFVSYGLIFNFAKLPFNLYLVHGINGIAVTLARVVIIFWPLPDIIGRRNCFLGCFLLGGIAGLSILAVPNDLDWLLVTLSLISGSFISMTFTLVYLYTAELFPTEVRNASISTGSVFARIGAICAPYLTTYLYGFHYAIPSAIFGALAALAGGVCCFIPETKGKPLPETVAELEESNMDATKIRQEEEVVF